MAGSRSTPPLFDLLRGAQRQEEVKPVQQARPAPAATPKPAPAMNKPVVRLDATASRPSPRPEAAPPAAPRAAAEPAVGPARRQTVTVSVTWLWLALAGVLSLMLVVWATAYKFGQKAEADRLGRFEVAGVSGPQPSQPPPNIAARPPAPEKTAAKPPAGDKQPQAGTPPATPSPLSADTRQAGFNYLLCASQLDKVGAEAAAGFLTKNGVPAVAVPSGKSGTRYAVYTLLGIPSGSLDEKLKERNDHKAEVVRIGKLWRKERVGAPDFADAYWEKFKP